jgi:hypothetical protein
MILWKQRTPMVRCLKVGSVIQSNSQCLRISIANGVNSSFLRSLTD